MQGRWSHGAESLAVLVALTQGGGSGFFIRYAGCCCFDKRLSAIHKKNIAIVRNVYMHQILYLYYAWGLNRAGITGGGDGEREQ